MCDWWSICDWAVGVIFVVDFMNWSVLVFREWILRLGCIHLSCWLRESYGDPQTTPVDAKTVPLWKQTAGTPLPRTTPTKLIECREVKLEETVLPTASNSPNSFSKEIWNHYSWNKETSQDELLYGLGEAKRRQTKLSTLQINTTLPCERGIENHMQRQ